MFLKMLLKVFLLCSAFIVQVSANPLFQSLNGQSQPVHYCQQDYRSQPIHHQPSNIKPYVQQPIIQNQTPCPCNQNQYDQLIYNKILSNPTLRTLLDPNTKLVNHNGAEVPRQLPNTCPSGVPNVINNYIIVPPELLLNEVCQQENQDRRCNNRRQGETCPRRNREGRRRNTDADVRTEDRGNQRKSRNGRQRQTELQYDDCEREIDDDYLEYDRRRAKSRKPQNDRRNAERRGIDKAKQNESVQNNTELKQKEVIKFKDKDESGEKAINTNTSRNSPNSTINYNLRIKDHVSNNQVASRAKDRALNENVALHAQNLNEKLTLPTVRDNIECSRKESPKEVHLETSPTVRENIEYSRKESPKEVHLETSPTVRENIKYSRKESPKEVHLETSPKVRENIEYSRKESPKEVHLETSPSVRENIKYSRKESPKEVHLETSPTVRENIEYSRKESPKEVRLETSPTVRENIEYSRKELPKEIHLESSPKVRESLEYSRKESPKDVYLDLRPKINIIPQNPREEAVIQDFRRKFPAIPENVVRNLLSHMKRQLQNEQLGFNPYYSSFPIHYDQLYPKQLPNSKKNNYNKRNKNGQRRNGRNRSKKQKQKNNELDCDCETTVELTPKLFPEESMTTEPITENINAQSVITESTTIGSEKVTDNTTTPKVDVSETTTQSTPAEKSQMNEQMDDLYDKTAIPELGTEDVVPTIYQNGIVDDYYPDFTADNHAYIFSNEEFSLKNFKDERYHYTTDKNFKLEELNRERRKYETDNKNGKNLNSEINNTGRKSIAPEEIEVTISRPQESEELSEEIHFRPPPFLEAPDFETKQINKDAYTTDGVYYFPEHKEKYVEVTDKISAYSNAKTHEYHSKENSAMKKKMPKTDIETVYARSKVVKFGHAGDENVSGDKTTKFSEESEFNSDGKQPSLDGDTTLVIAKSYPGAFW